MSRSRIRNKYTRKWCEDASTGPRKFVGKDLFHLKPVLLKDTNKHRLDEMPKNKASKSITMYCKDDIESLNRATYCCGHSTNKGRRIVSGIVRANLKRETQKKIKEELDG